MIQQPTDPLAEYVAKYEEPANHIKAILSASILTLDLRPRLLFPIWEAGIHNVAQLIRQHRQGWRNFPRIGVCAASEINDLLTAYALNEMELPQQADYYNELQKNHF